jgi:glycosyltransferase involved in cell wall biosynthesis
MTLIKSLTKIRNKKKIHLTIIGKGQNEHKLKKYVKENNLKSIVSFLGYKINPFPYIKKADVFVLSSRYEGSPNVLIEAQFLNKYIISTDCPTGPREILKYYKNSKLFKIGNSKKLADIIDNLKKNKKTTHTNFFHGLHKYKVENNCRDYVKVIQNLI